MIDRRGVIAALVAVIAGCGGTDPETSETVADQLDGTPTRSPTDSPTPTPDPPVQLTTGDTAGTADGYPTFGYTPQRTSYVTDDAGPPGPDEGWTHGTPAPVHSSPAIVDGRVYASSLEACYAVDLETGQREWRLDTGGGFSSPAVADGVVHVGGRDGTLYAADAVTGEVRWEFFTGDPIHSGPAVVDDHVYVGGFDANLYAIDRARGEERWRYDMGDVVPGSVTVGDRGLYSMGFDGRLHAVDFAGDRRWVFATNGEQVLGEPSVAGGVVFAGSNDARVYAIDADNGEALWRYQTRTGVGTAPTVTPDTVYVAALDGFLYALSAGRGELRWERRLGTGISSPVVVDETLYVGTRDGTVYAVDRRTGDTLWRYRTGEDVRSSPAVTDGVLAVGSADGSIHALGEGLRRVTPTAIDVTLTGAPNGVETFAVRVETGGARIAAIEPELVTGTGFTVDEGGRGEAFVVASGIVLSDAVSLDDGETAVLFTVKLAEKRTREELSLSVQALTDADGSAMDPDRVSLRVRDGGRE